MDAASLRGGRPALWADLSGALCVLEFEDGGSGEKFGAGENPRPSPAALGVRRAALVPQTDRGGEMPAFPARAGMFISTRCSDQDLVVGRLTYPKDAPA